MGLVYLSKLAGLSENELVGFFYFRFLLKPAGWLIGIFQYLFFVHKCDDMTAVE